MPPGVLNLFLSADDLPQSYNCAYERVCPGCLSSSSDMLQKAVPGCNHNVAELKLQAIIGPAE